MYFFYLWGISVITLGFIGGFPAKYPYIQFGKFFTIIYFLSYIINYIFGKYEDTRCVLMLNLSNKTKAWLIWRIWTRFKVWSNKNYNNVSKPYQTKLVQEMEKKKLKIYANRIDFSKLKKTNSFKSQLHGFHIVKPSPWPFLTALAIFMNILVCLEWFSFMEISVLRAIIPFIYLISIISAWCRDVIVESTFQGKHTLVVQKMMRAGFKLVLLSEAMFFFWFFLMFFIYVNFTIRLNWVHMTSNGNWTNTPFWFTIIKYSCIIVFWRFWDICTQVYVTY